MLITLIPQLLTFTATWTRIVNVTSALFARSLSAALTTVWRTVIASLVLASTAVHQNTCHSDCACKLTKSLDTPTVWVHMVWDGGSATVLGKFLKLKCGITVILLRQQTYVTYIGTPTSTRRKVAWGFRKSSAILLAYVFIYSRLLFTIAWPVVLKQIPVVVWLFISCALTWIDRFSSLCGMPWFISIFCEIYAVLRKW